MILMGAVTLAGPVEDHTALRKQLQQGVMGKGNAEAALTKQAGDASARESLLQFALLDVFMPEEVAQVRSTPPGKSFIAALRGQPAHF